MWVSLNFRLGTVLFGFAFVFFGFTTVESRAQENEECIVCHEDAELTGERSGNEIKVFVDPETYQKSIHADFACIDCHMDLADSDFPHEEELEPVDCALCHDDVVEEHQSGPQ